MTPPFRGINASTKAGTVYADQQIDLIATLQCHHLSIAPHPSIEAALKPVQLFERISQRGCDFGSRSAIQPICLD
jgi:hypothetical protein